MVVIIAVFLSVDGEPLYTGFVVVALSSLGKRIPQNSERKDSLVVITEGAHVHLPLLVGLFPSPALTNGSTPTSRAPSGSTTIVL